MLEAVVVVVVGNWLKDVEGKEVSTGASTITERSPSTTTVWRVLLLSRNGMEEEFSSSSSWNGLKPEWDGMILSKTLGSAESRARASAAPMP